MGGGVAGLPKIYPNERALNQEVDKTYSRFLSKAKEDKILLDNTDESKKIEEIGKEIYTSLDTFYINKREKNPVENFNWQFALIESDTKMHGVCLVEKLLSTLVYFLFVKMMTGLLQ